MLLLYSIVSKDTYGCTGRVNRGSSFCTNSNRVSRRILERKLLETLKDYLFNDEAIDIFTREIHKQLELQLQDRDADRQRIRNQLLKAKKERDNIFDAIKQGMVMASMKNELEQVEAVYNDLKIQYDSLDRDLGVVQKKLPVAADLLKKMTENLDEVLNKDLSKARLLIAEMVHEKIKVHPTNLGYLEAEMRGDYSKIIEMVEGIDSVVKFPVTRNHSLERNQPSDILPYSTDTRNQLSSETRNHSLSDCSVGCGGAI